MSEAEWTRRFAKRLLRLMIDSRVGQNELADLTGISKGSISKLVRGQQIPSVRVLINISYALHCTVDELIDFGEMIL